MTARPDDPAAPADPPHPDSDPDRTLLARDVAAAVPTPASPQASSNVLPEGTQLAEFSVTGVIGEGGFGIVYRAHDRALQRTVAIKEYMPSALAARLADTRVVVKSEQHRETFEVGLKSFINEARLLAQFDHPALVKVFRFWAANGTADMAMPLYEGGTLKQALKSMGAPPDEAWLRKLLVPLLDAIELLHAADCLHRDIAPDNVLMAPGSTLETPRPVLLDFGAARRVIGGQTQALTVILKPGYAPIEQYDEIPGMKQGPWTDLYALGAVMHFAITGKPPPPSVGRLVHDAWVPLSQAAAGRYSAGFLAAIDAVLAARPDDRPRSVAQWRASLADPAGGAPMPAAAPALDAPTSPRTQAPTAARATTAPRTTTAPAAPIELETEASPRRRPRWGAAVGFGALAGGLVILGLWAALTWQTRETAPRVSVPPPQPAVTRSEPAVPNRAPITAPIEAPPAATPIGGGSDGGSPAALPAASPPSPASIANAGKPSSAPAAGAAAPAAARAAPVPDARGAARGIAEPGKTATPPATALGTPPAASAAAATAWIDTALREGRDCLAARQYACTIARAEAVLQAEPNHPAAQALLKEGRAGQEAALGGDWKMR
jgi:serine/threonine protein kinase